MFTDFSSQMERIYYIEKDDSLSQEDMEILSPLAHCAEYFSPYQEDREQYKGFTNEDTVKKTAEEAYRKLLCHYKMDCNGVQREHNKKLNNGLPILHKVPPKRDYGRYFCIMAEKGGTSHGGLTEKLSPFFHAKKQEVNAYGR